MPAQPRSNYQSIRLLLARVVFLTISLGGFSGPQIVRVWADDASDSNVESDADAQASVDFSRDIAPIFNKNCVACHNAQKSEGGLNLESYESLRQGGDSGEAVAAGDPDDSYLLWRVTGEVAPIMPPEDNAVDAEPLEKEHVELLAKWIAAGANPPSSAEMPDVLQWQPLADNVSPSYALISAPDESFIAAGRGRDVFVIDAGELLRSTEGSEPSQARDNPSSVQHLLDAGTNDPAHGSELPPATHLDLVQSLAVSSDSQILATGGYRTVKIWQRDSQPRTLLTGLATDSEIVSVSPDGQWIASSLSSQGLELAHLSSGRAHRFLKTHVDPLSAICWSDDSSILLAADQAGRIILYEPSGLSSTELSLQPGSPPRWMSQIAPQRFALLDGQGKVRLLEFTGDNANFSADSAQLSAVQLEDIAACLAMDHDSNRLIVATRGGEIQRVDCQNWDRESLFQVEGSVRQLAMDTGGTRLAIVPESGPAALWSLASKQPLATLEKDYHRQRRLRLATTDHQRQEQLVSRSEQRLAAHKEAAEKEREAKEEVAEAREEAAKQVTEKSDLVQQREKEAEATEEALKQAEQAVEDAMRAVEEKKAELEKQRQAVQQAKEEQVAAKTELEKREQALAAAEDSAQRAAARIPETESLIKIEQQRLADKQAQLDELQAAGELPQVEQLRFTISGDRIIGIYGDEVARLYATDNGQPLANFDAGQQLLANWIDEHGEWITLDAVGQVKAWKLNRPWRLANTIGSTEESPFSDRITALDFSPDGKRLVVGSGPPSRFGDLKIIAVDTGEIELDLEQPHSDTILAARFSPSGRMLASAGADKVCRIFDLESGELIHNLEGHTHHILSLAWQNSENILATGSADTTIKIWEVDSGTQQRTISAFSKEVSDLEFVGTTGQLMATSNSGECKLFDSQNGNQIRAFSGADKALYSLSLVADQKYLLAAGLDGAIRVWQVDNGQAIKTYR